METLWSVGRPRRASSRKFGAVFDNPNAGLELVCDDRLGALVAPSSLCDISLVRRTRSECGPTALCSPEGSAARHTSHTSLSAISHSQLNMTPLIQLFISKARRAGMWGGREGSTGEGSVSHTPVRVGHSESSQQLPGPSLWRGQLRKHAYWNLNSKYSQNNRVFTFLHSNEP